MSGKGSKQRPSQIKRNIFESNWDKIFGMKEHKTTVQINEVVSRHWSDNGRKESIVKKCEKGFSVELYEQSRHIRTVECFGKSLKYAEDTAENFCLGMLE